MCNIFMIESHFQTQVSLKFSRLLLHTTFFSPETWNFSLLVSNWNGISNFAFCLLSFWYYSVFLAWCIPLHSVQFPAISYLLQPCPSPLSSHFYLLCYPASTFFCLPTFTAIQILKQIHINTIAPFSSKYTFNIFINSLSHANTANQHVDQRVSLFLHISSSNCWVFVFVKCTFSWGHQASFCSLCDLFCPANNLLLMFHLFPFSGVFYLQIHIRYTRKANY